MNKKKIFLTGGSGFIGRHILELLGSKYIFLSPTSGELNLLDYDNVFNFLKENNVHTIVHAANFGGKRNQKDMTDVDIYNLKIFDNLIKLKEFYHKLIFLGSGAEYDKSKDISLVKEEEFGQSVPQDGYGHYKYQCAKYAQDVDFVIHLRLFGIFGPYEDYSLRFISNNICRVLCDMPLHINQNVFFDYLYVKDFVRILDWFLSHEEVGYKHYNVCSGKRVDLLTVAKKILEISGKDLEIKIKKPGMNKEYTGNNERLLQEMGEFGFTSLDESVKELFNWYKEHLSAVDKESLSFDK